MGKEDTPETPVFKTTSAAGRTLAPAARRALEEAEQRRQAYREAERGRPKELGGRDGPEPVRYGDWERNGIASDF